MVNNSAKSQRLLIFEVAVFSLLLMVRDIGGIEFNKFVFLPIAVILFAFMDMEQLICSLCFLLPLLNGLPGNYIILAWILIYLLKTRYVKSKVIVLFAIYVILEIISGIGLTENSLVDTFSYLAYLFAFLMMINNDTEFSRKKCLWSYFIGVSIFVFITFFSTLVYAPSNWLTLFANGWYRFGNLTGVDSMHIGTNANELAYFAAVGFSVGLVLLALEAGNLVRRNIIYVLSLFVLILGALSTSRSYILVIAIIILFYFAVCKKSIKGFLIALLAMIIAVGVIYYILEQYPDLLTGFISRFDSETTSTAGSRTILWQQYWEAFFSKVRYILLGTGVVGYKEATGLYHSTHNMFQQIIMCYGVPFGFVFIVSILRPAVACFKNIKTKVLWLPLLAVLLFTQTIQFLNPWNLMLHYIVGVFALQTEGLDSSALELNWRGDQL